MASVFPLPEGNVLPLPAGLCAWRSLPLLIYLYTRAAEWLEWLGDEERQARDNPVAKIQILSLYEQAVQDYRCTTLPTYHYGSHLLPAHPLVYMSTHANAAVALWERYARFAEEFYGEDHAAVRTVYEDALTAVGLHVSEGARVWHAYRQFELKQEEGGSSDATERVRKLFVRQLGVPLAGMDDTLQAYLAWETAHGGDPAQGRRAHEAASARLQEYMPFEAQVDGPWSGIAPHFHLRRHVRYAC
jgi:hypothetical protein